MAIAWFFDSNFSQNHFWLTITFRFYGSLNLSERNIRVSIHKTINFNFDFFWKFIRNFIHQCVAIGQTTNTRFQYSKEYFAQIIANDQQIFSSSGEGVTRRFIGGTIKVLTKVSSKTNMILLVNLIYAMIKVKHVL